MTNTFDELLAHAGHKTETVYYGTENQAVKVSIECVTCGCVLVELTPGDVLNKTTADKLICPGWDISDVIAQAKENDINLSDQQAREILQRISDKMDANVGVNWDVIDYHTNKYLEVMSGG
jgi:hypothetical protein